MAENLRPPPSTASKGDWRTWAKAVAEGLDWPGLSGAISARLRRFPPLRHGATVLTYLPTDQEIDLRALRESAPMVRWVTTRTPAEGPLTIHEMVEPYETHDIGFQQPRESAPHVDPHNVDIVLVPALAYDLYGNRLGHGLGYYDELLRRMRPSTVFVGVIPSALVADKIPAASHDVPVHWLAAEEGVVGVVR